MYKHLKSALMCGLLVGGAATLSAQAPQQTQPQPTQPQSTTPQTKGGAAERVQGTPGHVKEYSAGQKLIIDVTGGPERSFDLTSRDQSVVVAPGLKAGDAVRIVESNAGGQRTINIMMDSANR
jgi:hypothetical protein